MANADTLDGAGVNSGNALDAAKIQLNSETMKFYMDKYPIPGGLHQVTVHAPWPPSPHANYFSNKKIEKQRDYNAPQALSGDTELTARAANVLNSAAKVQQNSDISKENQERNPKGAGRKKLPINEKKESKAIRVPGELADLLKEIGDLAKENPDRIEQLKSQCTAIIENYR